MSMAAGRSLPEGADSKNTCTSPLSFTTSIGSHLKPVTGVLVSAVLVVLGGPSYAAGARLGSEERESKTWQAAATVGSSGCATMSADAATELDHIPAGSVAHAASITSRCGPRLCRVDLRDIWIVSALFTPCSLPALG